jgi:hypothetical protein
MYVYLPDHAKELRGVLRGMFPAVCILQSSHNSTNNREDSLLWLEIVILTMSVNQIRYYNKGVVTSTKH